MKTYYPTFEYRIETTLVTANEMNELGAKGWEAVGMNESRVLFKRGVPRDYVRGKNDD